MTLTIEYDNRTWELELNESPLPNVRAELLKNGFDGTIWNGRSILRGRQRRVYYGSFYRTQDGRFVGHVPEPIRR